MPPMTAEPRVSRSIHRRMTVGESEDFPRRQGWKHEYWDGTLHVTPAHVIVPLYLSFDWQRGKRPEPAEETLRPAREEDYPRLVDLFVRAFAPTMEYVDYRLEKVRESAQRCLDRAAGKEHGRRLEASQVAEAGGELCGAALLRQSKPGPLLDILFVDPSRHRRGLANALVHRAVRELSDAGERKLYSRVMLGNEASLAWHLEFGFRELPEPRLAGHRWRLLADELDRHRRLSDLSPTELAEREKTTAYWKRKHRCLNRLARRKPELVYRNLDW